MPGGLRVTPLAEGFWLITDPGYARPSHCYLLAGRERAALIDSGLGMLPLRETVEGLTGLDVVVLQTHAHPDHAGASHQFEQVYAHPSAVDKLCAGWTNMELRFTLERYFKDRTLPDGVAVDTFTIPPCRNVVALENRGFVELGDRQVDVLFTPGHSTDSVTFFDLERGLLFIGDMALKGQIAVENANLYRRSMIALGKLAALAATVYPAHGETPLAPQFVRHVRQGFTEALAGRHPSGFLAGFTTYQFEDFGLMLPPRSRRTRDE